MRKRHETTSEMQNAQLSFNPLVVGSSPTAFIAENVGEYLHSPTLRNISLRQIQTTRNKN